MEQLEKLLNEQLPSAFARKSIDELLPGIISPKTQANLDSLGKGPESFKMGRNVFYCREHYLPWLIKRIRKNNN